MRHTPTQDGRGDSAAQNNNNTDAALQLLSEAMAIAGEAIYLADAYAGGDSENADRLSFLFEKLEARVGIFREQNSERATMRAA
jgi:hypothetical protein